MRGQVAAVRVMLSVQVGSGPVTGAGQVEIPVMATATGAEAAADDEVLEVTLVPDLDGLRDALEGAMALVADRCATVDASAEGGGAS